MANDVSSPIRPLSEAESRSTEERARVVTFVVVFWGEKFRRLFVDYCLASLLAPNNLPFIATEGAYGVSAKFLICSTEADYAALSVEPLFEMLRGYVEPELIDIGEPQTSTMLHMSKGHKAALQHCIADKSYCSILAPDIVLSNGSIRKLVDIVNERRPLALFPAFRFDLDDVRDRLCAGGYLQSGRPLTIDARPLAAIASESFHSEIQCFEFDSAHFSDYPHSATFRRPGNGWLLHTGSWGIAVADCAYLERISDEHFDADTIDAHFINDQIYGRAGFDEPVILNDSDDFLMVPLTTEADMPQKFLLRPNRLYLNRPSGQVDAIKAGFIRSLLFSPAYDAFKRWAYRIPVNIHPKPLPANGDAARDRGRSIVELALERCSLPTPLYLLTTICDNVEFDQFCRVLSYSLRAPNNAPLLAGIPGCRLLIATTAEHKQNIIEAYSSVLLSYFLEIECIEIADFDPHDGLSANTARGIQLCVERCIKDGVFGSFVAPDVILADGTIRRIIELIGHGHQAVVAPVPHFRYQTKPRTSDKLLTAQEIGRSGRTPIVLSGRQLAGAILECAVPELLEGNCGPAACLMRPTSICAKEGSGFIIHSVDWVVLMCDFRAVRELTKQAVIGGTTHEAAFNRELLHLQRAGKLYIATNFTEVGCLSVAHGIWRQLATKSAPPSLEENMFVDPLWRQLYLTAVALHVEDQASLSEPAIAGLQRRARSELEKKPSNWAKGVACLAQWLPKRTQYFYEWEIPWRPRIAPDVVSMVKEVPAPLRWVVLLFTGVWIYRKLVLKRIVGVMAGDRDARDWIYCRFQSALVLMKAARQRDLAKKNFARKV